MSWTFYILDILCLPNGRFVPGRSAIRRLVTGSCVTGRFVTGRFVGYRREGGGEVGGVEGKGAIFYSPH